MKKLIAAAALLVLVTGGFVFSGTQSVSAESPRTCLAALNMVGDTDTPGDPSTWNFGMFHAMAVDNANGNIGMGIAVTGSMSHKAQTPPCQ